MKSRVQKRAWNDQLEIKMLSMNLLSSVLDKLTKSITLRLNLYDIDEEFTDQFQNILEEHKGSHQLKLHVHDPDESVVLELLSRTYKVKISKQLVQDISTLVDVQYKLN